MRITGSLPLHIARAYGLPPTGQAGPLKSAESVAPAQRPRRPDVYQSAEGARLENLVAAKVSQAVDFNTSDVPRPEPGDALQLYTRAADKVEAAVAVQVGRNLDVTG